MSSDVVLIAAFVCGVFTLGIMAIINEDRGLGGTLFLIAVIAAIWIVIAGS